VKEKSLKKKREDYKRDRIRYLYVYAHYSQKDIADLLNSDPEFKRKCGSISIPTVAYWIKKIKGELENAIDIDGLERFTAEFVRKSEFMDNEVSEVTKLLQDKGMKMEDRIKLMNMRHRMAVDQITLLADKELPLTVKKYKNDRKVFTDRLNLITDEEQPKIEFKDVSDNPKFKNRVVKEEDEEPRQEDSQA